MISNPAKRADACPQTLDSFLYSKLQVICVSLRNTFLQFQVELAMSSLYFSFLSALYSLFYSLTLFDINFSLTLAENSLLHKSKAVHGEGAMVRVDRKCEAYVGRRFAAALLPRLFGKNPRSHHKGPTSRVRTGNLKHTLLDDAVLFTVAAPECPRDIHFEDDLEGPSHNYKFVPSLMSAQGKGHSRVGEYLQSVKYFRNSGIPFVLRHREWAEGWIQAQGINTAIHVRRAEYAGGVRAPASYYDKALQTLARRAPGELLRFIILTDDPDWVRQQPVFQGMPVAQGNSPAHDLALIAACKHIILSLGTFGLWGAYMKKSQEVGFVIYWLVSFQISNPDFEAEGTWLPHWIPIAAS